MITGIIEVTQDPEQAGSTLKILSLRLRGMKGQLQELGEETDENVENISKMQGQILNLTKGKVNIFDSVGEFRSTYEIMQDISEVWDDLTSTAQADLLETIAGKHRANSVAALLSNWQNVEAAVKSASEAEGSAARENAKYVDSIQGRLDKLTTVWQSFANTFMSSDFLKGAIGALTGFVEGLEKVVDTIGAFPTLMGTIAAGMSTFKNTGFFSVLNKDVAGAQKQLSLLGKSFKDISRDMASGQGLFKSLFSQSITKSDVGYITEYFRQVKSGVPVGQAYTNTLANASVAGKKMAVNIKKGTASMSSLKTATIGGKAALFGLEAAATAANIALTMGLSFAIQLVVDGIMKLVNADKELAESVEEITSKFKEQSDSLKKLKGDYDTSNESSMISKYEKLSKGVDGLGRNVSLTADEYSEYQSIVNQIAEQIPSLVSGYDSQGNALLSCKGNVESLTEAYEKLIHAQNQEILTNTKDIEKNFKNQAKDAGDISVWERLVQSAPIVDWFVEPEDLPTDVVKKLENALNNPDAIKGNWLDAGWDNWDRDSLKKALQDSGVDVKWYQDPITVLKETLKTDPAKIKGIVDDHYAQFAEIVEQQKTIATAKLSEAFDVSSVISGLNYGNIGEELQTIAYQTINSLDYDFFSELSESGKSVEQWVTDMLNQLNAISKEYNDDLEVGFELQTKFNGGEISYGEYINGLHDVQSTIDKLNLKGEAKEQLEISLGLDENGVIDQYNNLVKRLTDSKNYDFNISESEAKKLLDGLNAEEFSVAADVIFDLSNNDYDETAEEILTAIERELSIRGLSLDLSIETEKTKLEALSTAIAESVSGSGLSEESIGAVKGIFSNLSSYDPSKLFERTANGIRLNTEEYRRLNSEYKKINTANINKEMDTLGDIYNQTREELYRLTYGTEEYNDKARELDSIEQQIKDLEQLSAGYKGLASAFQEWQMVESAGSQRDMYETMIEGWENVGDEISRGWIDDGTREFFELLKGETATIIDGDGAQKEINIATASAKELKKVWKDLDKNIEHTTHSVRDFFTVDEDGNSTSQGVYNFLDAIGQMEEEEFGGEDVVQRKDGKIIGFNFDLVGGDKVIAEALGVSEELVQIMKRAAADAGFVVSFDGTYQQLDILREKAQKASESLNKVLKKNGQKGYNFNFNATEVDDVKKQLTEAQKILDTFRNTDGTINTKLEGADEALTVASTLQSMLDKLTRPAYMEIEVSQVEEDLRKPLQNLQDYRTKIEQLNQAKLHGADTTELEASIKESKEKILDDLQEIQKSNPELAAELEIKGLSREEIEKKIETGEIKIPATIDLQLEMDEKLGILVDKALLDAGIISPEEFQKRVDVYLDAEVDNDDAKEKTENAVDEVAEGEKRKQNIEIIAETFGVENVDDLTSKLEGLDDKTIQAIAEVVGNVGVEKLKLALVTMTDVQVQAVAEAIGKGDVEGLKTAIGNLDSNTVLAIARAFGYKDVNELNTAIENLDPKTVQAIAQALGLGNVNTLQSTVNNMQGNTVDAKVNTDGQKEKIDTLQGWINGLTGRIVTVGVQLANAGKKKAAQRTGADPAGNDSEVNGTANINGTTGRAFVRGDWRTKRRERALVGELGREIIVTPNNQWYTVGDTGAEFVNIPKNSIVFNHRQTEELLRNGKVTSNGGRAKAFANGTAFLSGTAFDVGTATGDSSPEVNSYNVGSNKGSNKETESKFEDTIDWIETILDRAERAIDKYEKQANNVYKTWAKRNKALENEIVEVGNTISLYEQAKNKYLSEANSVGLSEAYASKVRNGSLSIEDFAGESDEALVEKIKNYQDLYNKYLDCIDKIDELKETEASLYAQRFENVQTQYDSLLQGFDHTETMLNEYINQAEEQGHIVSKKYYEALTDNEEDRIAKLKQEQADLIAERDAAVASGEIKKESQKWYEFCAAIDETTQAIEEGETAILSYAKSMKEIDFEIFDLIQQRISDVTDEADFYIELMSNEKLFDKNNKLTDQGLTTLGLHAQNYNTSMYQADLYGEEAAKIKEQLDALGDAGNKDLEDRYRELIGLQRELILSAEDSKNAIADLVREGIELEIDALGELIDEYQNALDSQKDLYNYQRKIEQHTSTISSLEKQISAYQNDTSEESKATVQRLKQELEEANKDLEADQYDKYIADQSTLLDSLYDNYSSLLNERLDNTDDLVRQVIDAINGSTESAATGSNNIVSTLIDEKNGISSNASLISETLTKEATSVGTTLSTAMSNIWDTDGKANAVVSMYGDKVTGENNSVKTVLDGIASSVGTMVTKLDAKAKEKIETPKTNPSSIKNPTTGTQETKPSTTTTTPATNKADNTKKISNATLMGIASAIWVHGSKAGWENDPTRKNKLGTKLGEENAKKVQQYINRYSSSGALTRYWYENNLKLADFSYNAFKLGAKKIDESQLAWTQEGGQEYIVRPSDGAILTPVAKGDSVLTSAASNNIWNMANNPAEFIKDNLSLGAASVPNNSTVQNSCVQNFDKIIFSMPNVHNYNEMLAQMQRDPNFERLIDAMSIGKLAGKSSLAKGKALR